MTLRVSKPLQMTGCPTTNSLTEGWACYIWLIQSCSLASKCWYSIRWSGTLKDEQIWKKKSYRVQKIYKPFINQTRRCKKQQSHNAHMYLSSRILQIKIISLAYGTIYQYNLKIFPTIYNIQGPVSNYILTQKVQRLSKEVY